MAAHPIIRPIKIYNCVQASLLEKKSNFFFLNGKVPLNPEFFNFQQQMLSNVFNNFRVAAETQGQSGNLKTIILFSWPQCPLYMAPFRLFYPPPPFFLQSYSASFSHSTCCPLLPLFYFMSANILKYSSKKRLKKYKKKWKKEGKENRIPDML